jgi:peptide/nickel transport system substrate-binding protein
MFKKGLYVVICGIIILGFSLAGCTKTTVTTSPPPSSPTTTITQSTSPTPTPSVTSEPQHGGTLRIIQGAEVDSIGWVSDQVSPEDYMQRGPVLETLVHYDENANQPVGLLAQSIVEDPAAKTITFNLRKNVKFHDGTPFNADACIWNLTQIKDSPNLSASWVNASKDNTIEKVGDYTVKVNFQEWDNTFLRNMCWDSAMISPTAYTEKGLDWIRDNAVGTGPFKQASFQRDVKKTFTRFDGYWQQGKPYLDEIDFNIIADTTVQMASLLKGDNDMITNLNPTDAKSLKDNPKFFITHGVMAGEVSCLFGDSGHPDSPFSKLEVRQAISYAIDRKAIADFVYYGYAQPANQMVGSQCTTYNPNVVGYPYNPDKARALLAAAGYSSGFNTVLICRSDKIEKDIYTAVQSNLADIGIKADLQAVNPGQYGEIMFGTGWSNGLLGGAMLSDPEIGIMAFYHFSLDSGLGIPQSTIHPEDLEAAIKGIMTGADAAKKKAASWDFEYLTTDKYCFYSPIVVHSPLAVKSIKVHGDYIATTYSSNPPIWTFADVWLDH